MSIIPCKQNEELREKIEKFADVLKTQAHLLGDHGLTEREFYESGLFRGAIESVRGQFSATKREKSEFVERVLNYLEDKKLISSWERSGQASRHDYVIDLLTKRVAVISLTGCMDGNNAAIFTRPSMASEFFIWSVCSNPGADPRKNVWSGIHTRIVPDILSGKQVVDGLIIWDMFCGTITRPCPKISSSERRTSCGPFQLVPPCIYVLPKKQEYTTSSCLWRAPELRTMEFLSVLRNCFGGFEHEDNYIDILQSEDRKCRKTLVRRGGAIILESKFTMVRNR